MISSLCWLMKLRRRYLASCYQLHQLYLRLALRYIYWLGRMFSKAPMNQWWEATKILTSISKFAIVAVKTFQTTSICWALTFSFLPWRLYKISDRLITLGRSNTFNRLNKKFTRVNKTFCMNSCKRESRPVKTTSINLRSNKNKNENTKSSSSKHSWEMFRHTKSKWGHWRQKGWRNSSQRERPTNLSSRHMRGRRRLWRKSCARS